ncbi:MAG TPA: DsbA family oxidoreductase [Xanthobacteraceae bacterium]|nr:DsbA family oxidoreductase [Xanthobacteraceae bacterium]
MSVSALPIDVMSDVVCPWCYVGKRYLEKAIALKPEIPVEVRFRPYLLNPWVPREGMSREDYLVTKFGSVERYNTNSQRIIDIAAAAGLDYARDKIKRQPNTIDCHRLIAWAADPAQMKQRLMQLYFAEGGDLTDPAVLVAAAAECGMDAAEVARRLATDEDVARIEAEANTAKEAGIQGVPFFIFGNLLAVSGANPPEHLAQAIEQASNEFAKQVAAE